LQKEKFEVGIQTDITESANNKIIDLTLIKPNLNLDQFVEKMSDAIAITNQIFLYPEQLPESLHLRLIVDQYLKLTTIFNKTPSSQQTRNIYRPQELIPGLDDFQNIIGPVDHIVKSLQLAQRVINSATALGIQSILPSNVPNKLKVMEDYLEGVINNKNWTISGVYSAILMHIFLQEMSRMVRIYPDYANQQNWVEDFNALLLGWPSATIRTQEGMKKCMPLIVGKKMLLCWQEPNSFAQMIPKELQLNPELKQTLQKLALSIDTALQMSNTMIRWEEKVEGGQVIQMSAQNILGNWLVFRKELGAWFQVPNWPTAE